MGTGGRTQKRESKRPAGISEGVNRWLSMAKKRSKMSKAEEKYRVGLLVGICGGFIGSFFASALYNFAVKPGTPDWLQGVLFVIAALAFFWLLHIIETTEMSWRSWSKKPDKKMSRNDWIKIFGLLVSIGVLIVMVIGLFQINQLNINLREITANNISVGRINLLYPNGTLSGTYIYNNGTNLILQG